MKKRGGKVFTDSWFFKWFLDNKAVTAILITFLVFLTLYLLTKISFIFTPILSFLSVIMLPVVISAILYYLIKPFVLLVEKSGASRTLSIFIVYAIIVTLCTWAVYGVLPNIQEQLTSFIENLPKYIQSINREATKLLENPWLASYQNQLEEVLATVSSKAVEYAESFSTNILNWTSSFAGVVARVTMSIVISPFVVFYFLRDGERINEGLLKVIPMTLRQSFRRIIGDINKQLSGYVQGQVFVATVVGIMFSIMFSIIGLRYAVSFGIMAGILNMIPYLGSFLAMIPVVIIAAVQGPFMLIKVLIVFVIEQTIEGRFVSPLVLGSKLNIHPLTIMFTLLTAGAMFGVWGVFLAVPIYASMKVIIKEIFEWYKQVSGLYEEVTENQVVEEGEVAKENDK